MSKNELHALSRDLCLATHIEIDKLTDVLDRVDELASDGELEQALREVADQVRGSDLASLYQEKNLDIGWADSVCRETSERFHISIELARTDRSRTTQLWVDPVTFESVLWRKQNGDAATAIGFRALTAANGIVFPERTVFSVRPVTREAPLRVARNYPVNIYAYNPNAIVLYPQQILPSAQIDIRYMQRAIREMTEDWRPYSRIARTIRR